MRRAENINPEMLKWARERAGLPLEEAAKKIQLSGPDETAIAQKLAAFEAGENYPTQNQLFRMAKVYHRPLTIFYMGEPPPTDNRGEDFRVSAHKISPQEAGVLDALLRGIRVGQSMVRSILEDDEDRKPLDFVGSISKDRLVVAEATEKIRKTLKLGSAENLRLQFKSPEALFKHLREKIEGIGVFVILAGDLGSHHSRIGGGVFRGYASADEIAPFIVINPGDARSARSFTLIHELVHIFIASTGVSADPVVVKPASEKIRIERFCNDVAGEFLLPKRFLSDIGPFQSYELAEEGIAEIAKEWSVSEPMVAYRLRSLERISDSIYSKLIGHYAARWEEAKRQRRQQQAEKEGGPSYYVVRRNHLGNALLMVVGRALRESKLTHTKAAKILNVKAGKVEPLLQGLPSFDGSVASKGRDHAVSA